MKLAEIVKIKSFASIPNKDNIHTVYMEGNGWQVVCKKTDFNIGDLAVYFYIDVLVDKTNPALAFMETRKWRVWNCKFGGALSAGLLMPLSILTHYEVDISSLKEGDDLSEITKSQKFEKPIDLSQNTDAKGNFPAHLVNITDEDNLLSNMMVLDEFKDEIVYITQKQDGSSGTFIYNNGEFDVCSRRLILKDGENGWWRMAKKYNIHEKLKNIGINLSIQFELCGPKFNGNKLNLKEEQIFIFNIFDITTRKFYSFKEINDFCAALDLPTVPLLGVGSFNDFDIEKLKDLANNVKYGNNPGEGIVIRPINPKWSTVLGKWLSVKLINQNYKD